jgi:protein-tyrosine phosphatase
MFGLFKKKEEISVQIEWSNIGLDFHSHLIPAVDDGSSCIEETLEILEFIKSLGFQYIYTSPHIMGEGYKNTKSGLTEHFKNLQSDTRIQNLNLDLGIIAEYFLDEEFEKLLNNDELLTFGKKHILIETSMNYDFPFVKNYIYKLIKKGYNPILAHPERYKYIFSEKDYIDIYERYKDLGCEFQLNLFSLVGLYGDKIKSVAEDLIKNNMYDYVSSDIHKAGQLKLYEELNKSIFLERLIKSGNLKNNELLESIHGNI